MESQIKVLLKKCVYFSVGVLAMLFVAEWRVARVQTTYLKKRQLIEKQINKIETLSFGSSHTYYGINPSEFSRPGFNLSGVGQSLTIDQQLFERYLDVLPNIKIGIFVISFFSMEYSIFTSDSRWRNNFYIRNFDIRADRPFIDLMNPISYSLVYGFGIDKTRDFVFSFGPKDESDHLDSTGWILNQFSQIGPEGPSKEDILYRISHFHKIMFKSNFDLNIQALKKVVKLGQNHGVKSVFVTLPVSPSLNEAWMKTERWGETVGVLQKEFPGIYKDYSGDRRFGNSDFIDTDHLNYFGAKKISKIIEREILKKL